MSQVVVVVVVIEKDVWQFSVMFGCLVLVVVNGVDCEYFVVVWLMFEVQCVLFFGNYEYVLNVDVVEWMFDEILLWVWVYCFEVCMSVCGYVLLVEWV